MKKPGKKEVYSTIIVLALAMLALNLIFHLRYTDIAAAILLLTAIAAYPIASLVTMVWLKFAELLGTVNSKILLSLIFFVFLVPISFLYRLTKKDPLQKKKLKERNASYFHIRNHQYQPNDFRHTF